MKGSPYEESQSSEKKPAKTKKQDLTSLDDLPGLGGNQKQNDNDFDFGGFDDFDDGESD